MNINRAELCGRLTAHPEKKVLPSGAIVVNLGLATNHVYKDKSGQKQETTSFHNLIAFGKIAETIAQYCVKGQELFVTGRIDYRSWDKPDGGKGYKTEIIVDSFQFGQKPKDYQAEDRQTEEQPVSGMAEEFPPEEDTISPDSIPF